MRSENGNNFIGVVKKLWKCFQDMNEYLQMHEADWIT